MNFIESFYQRYAALGFSTMPTRLGSKKPQLDAWIPLQSQRAPAQTLTDWARSFPYNGIAVLAGLISGLIIIDDDRGGRPPNREADAFIAALEKLPTAIARTSKGRHFYFKLPHDVNGNMLTIPGRKVFGDWVETRGEGQYVLAPPSPHPNGTFYRWERDPELGILELPQWVYEAIKAPSASAGGLKPWELAVGGVSEGSRDSSAVSYLGRMLKLYPETEWNTTVWDGFIGWNKTNTPPLTDAEMQTKWNSITKRERGKQKITTTLSGTVFPAVDRGIPPTITAEELGEMHLEPPDFAVRDFIVDGTTQLFGKPKSGKSYLILQAELAVATGRPLFPATIGMHAFANHPQGFETRKGDALYLALEDSELRLQERIRQLWGTGPLPPNITLATQWWTSADGGLTAIENWIKSVKYPRLIGIDTVAAFFGGSVPSKGSAFRAEYLTFQPVWALSRQYHVPVLMADHASKGKGKGGSSDPFDTGAGTLGSQACVDTVIVMVRDDKDPRARLHIKSRDFEDYRFDIEHTNHNPAWKIALPKPSEESSSEAKVSKNGRNRASEAPT